MNIYVAVVRLFGQQTVKATFKAEDNVEAYNKMLKCFQCKGTEEMEEYELLEVRDGPSYRIVASKEKAKSAPTCMIPFAMSALPAPLEPEPADEVAIKFPTIKLA